VNDVNAFAAFASTGAFSTFIPPINDTADQILNGLNAYIISQAYQASGVFITRQLNTSVRALTTNGTALEYTLPCNSDYDENGICDTFWYDSVDDTTYALTPGNPDTRRKNYNSDMLTWFSNYTDRKYSSRALSTALPHRSPTKVPAPLSVFRPQISTPTVSSI